jgi:hypothetical protein
MKRFTLRDFDINLLLIVAYMLVENLSLIRIQNEDL